MLETIIGFFSTLSGWSYLLPALWVLCVSVVITASNREKDSDATLAPVIVMGCLSTLAYVILSMGSCISQNSGDQAIWEVLKPQWIMAGVYFGIAVALFSILKLLEKMMHGLWTIVSFVQKTGRGLLASYGRSDRSVKQKSRVLAAQLLSLLPETGFEEERSRVLEIRDELIPELLERRQRLNGDIAATHEDIRHFADVPETDPRAAHRKRMQENLVRLEEFLQVTGSEIEACLDLLRTAATDFRLLRYDQAERGRVEALFGDLIARTKASTEREREEQARAQREVERLPRG